ncbi:uncharacterized protein MICPUCDRAFT_51494 [Micromonas pusilla CCMP1545]|uniref:Predicted protein n=1 Tax=Micromonas pusilla (strain CCMP1545) TaxID=564608 RepID=C1N2E1_MICPC|nr:uncharacterized protein MICPUCDRAFT_51494 [Micromonas pusilla CCMP1545]EEH53571.1 predicted protein [Micromonas pusilla CCMP1545]|eukprot:XP_003061859.1 predicted protein [Micromonas pusilla CCMP1545]
MSAAPPGENPATVETPVDIAKLKSALGCPMCGEMFNFPVTVVRPPPEGMGRISPNSVIIHPLRARPAPRRELTPRSPSAPNSQIECLHTFCHACIVKEVQPGKPANACPKCKIALGAFYTLVPIRPRRRGGRRSLRTFAGVSLRPGSLAFNPRPRRLSTPPRRSPLGNNPFVEKKIVKDAPKTGLVDKLRSAGKCLSAEEQSAWDAKAAAAAAAAATTTTG